MKITNTVKQVKQDIIKDAFIKDYLKYIEYLENNNYVRERITIYENLSAMVTINNLKANNEGIVLDILCPPGRIISIPGIKSFPDDYYIENIPPFELRLADIHGEEISPDTQIKIFKKKILRKLEDICEIYYRDISMINYSESSNKFKNHNELYRFEQGIELKGEDHLKLYVIDPNIDIDKIKFNMNVDLWTPTE